MICSLQGTIGRIGPTSVSVTIGGVGYLVQVPSSVFEQLREGEEARLRIHTHVREEHFDLFGFLTEEDLLLFKALIALDGIGPKIALEICAIHKRDLHAAVTLSDTRALEAVKGIGKKKAEKLLVDLKSLYEKHASFLSPSEASESGTLDEDALSALVSLGYDRSLILKALLKLPKEIAKTEDRVTAVLRSL